MPDKTDSAKLQEVKELIEDMFFEMREVGATIHPWVMDHAFKVSDLLGIPHNKIPTEGLSLDRIPPTKDQP